MFLWSLVYSPLHMLPWHAASSSPGPLNLLPRCLLPLAVSAPAGASGSLHSQAAAGFNKHSKFAWRNPKPFWLKAWAFQDKSKPYVPCEPLPCSCSLSSLCRVCVTCSSCTGKKMFIGAKSDDSEQWSKGQMQNLHAPVSQSHMESSAFSGTGCSQWQGCRG